MDATITYTIAGAAIYLGGLVSASMILRWKDRNLRSTLANREKSALEAAQREAEAIIREGRLAANEDALKRRAEAEQFSAARQKEIMASEQRLQEREGLVNRQLETLVDREQRLEADQRQCASKSTELEKLRAAAAALTEQRRVQLASLAQLDAAELKAAFLKEVEQQSAHEAAQLSHHVLEEARQCAEEKARRIISIAIQRYAGTHCFETSTATVTISGDEIKGRIIGREGRNIRAFEAATGVTVMIDDTPGAVVLSGFDPVRRAIAREAMERLILDGRIHPARIEEVVTKVSQEMDEMIVHQGQEAVTQLGLVPLHPEVLKLLGRLHFRHSFSQNVLQHSVEVANLMGLMAAEMEIDPAVAKRAGLLHDIGKAVNHEVEGAHAIVGADFLKRFGESEEVVNAVASHHGEVPANGPLGALVGAADAISASRPGARSETVMTYIRRVDNLEKIGLSFPGVEKCFALQAGRELRVMVQPQSVTDDEAHLLARNIARRIEGELQYPGQIRVTIVRETRCVEFAK